MTPYQRMAAERARMAARYAEMRRQAMEEARKRWEEAYGEAAEGVRSMPRPPFPTYQGWTPPGYYGAPRQAAPAPAPAE
jgi:hypothetical protein